jgi:hypothetical protein
MRKIELPADVIADIEEFNLQKYQMLNACKFINNGRTPLIPYEY